MSQTPVALLREHLVGSRSAGAACFAFSSIAVAGRLVFPWFVGRLVDEVITEQQTGLLATYLAQLSILTAVTVAAALLAGSLAWSVAFDSAARLRRWAFTSILRFDTTHLRVISEGDLLTRCVNDVTKLENGITIAMVYLTQIPVLLIGSFVVVTWLSLELAVLAALTGVAMTMLSVVATRRTGRLAVARQDAQARFTDRTHDLVDSPELMRYANATGAVADLAANAARRAATTRARWSRSSEGLQPALLLCIGLATCALLAIESPRLASGETSAGTVVAMWSYLAFTATPVYLVAQLVPYLRTSWHSLERIAELAVAPDSEPAPSNDDATDASVLSLQGLSYGHRRSAADVLHWLDLNLDSGEWIGIHGRTGSGKTTLALVMSGLVRPAVGSICTSGVPLSAVDPAVLRSRIVMIPQHSHFFAGTVRDIFRFANERADDAALTSALHACALDDLADGLDGWIEAGATNLSGGQRQRLALARALVANPAVIIVDEGVSGIDPATLTLVFARLREVQSLAVVLLSSSATIAARADSLYDLADGRLIPLEEVFA